MTEAYVFLAKGGIIMIPILLASILGAAIFFERLWALQRPHVLPSRLLQVVTKLVKDREYDRAQALCEGNESSIAAVLAAGLRQVSQPRGVIKEVMEEAGRREAARLERGVGALGSIANLAPLMGLLGTVTGMIKVFQQVVNQVGDTGGQVHAGALANGIWEALLSTAAGLTVAIPIFVMFKYLTARVDRLLVEMEATSLDLADLMVLPAVSPRGPRTATNPKPEINAAGHPDSKTEATEAQEHP